MDNLSAFVSMMPFSLRQIFDRLPRGVKEKITELRIRKDKPVIIYVENKPYFLTIDGQIRENNDTCFVIDSESFNDFVSKICCNSYHTKMTDLINGYVTAENGSRIGVCSSAVIKNQNVEAVKNITSVNIRISHEIEGCSHKIIDQIYNNKLPSIIVAGKPSSGKTTFLRDYGKSISSGYLSKYFKVCFADERKELTSGFDIGINSDALIGFKKSKAIEMATRTMSPELIICDEIGSIDELNSIKYGFNCGVNFAVSIHIKNDNYYQNELLNRLIDTGEFDYLIVLKNYTNDYEIIKLTEENSENYRNDNDNPFLIFPWIFGD